MRLGDGFAFFFLNKTKDSSPLETQSLLVFQICAPGWSGFPPDGLPCPGGRCYLWLVMDVAKKKKGRTSIRLRKPLSELQEVNGGAFMGDLMDTGPTPWWDSPLHGMPGQGVCWSITGCSTTARHTPRPLIFIQIQYMEIHQHF